MMNMCWDLLKNQPAVETLPAGQERDRLYRYWRIRTMIALFVGYSVFYFCRKNLSTATPGLIQDLGYSKTQVGAIWSALYLTYGVSKLVNGVLGDRSNPRFFMAIGLFLSALTNIFFGMSSSIVMLSIFWGLNGWFQGMGWPACARSLVHWYSPNERGTIFGIWNASHQVGGAIILVMGGYLTQVYGWRSAFYIPAAFGILFSFFIASRLRDTPESLGLPTIEEHRNDHTSQANERHVSQNKPVRDILFKYVLGNKHIWFLSFGNFFVYLVRYGAMDWAPTFLVEVKKTTIANASWKAALFEILGILGALSAGWLSDKVFKSKRAPVNILYMGLLVFAVIEFWVVPPGHPVLDAIALSAVGFLVYGPQMLVGLAAADSVSKDAAATASGFTGLFGYLGSIASGVGTGYIVDHYGWNGGFLFFIVASVLGCLCFIPTWFDRSKVRKPVLG